MGLSPTILRQQLPQEPTDEVLREKEKKKRGRRTALERSRVWRNGREKKEERRIKKKRVRVHVWRRKKERKKRKKKMPCVEDKKRVEKKEKRRRKCYHNIFTILSQ